MHKERQTFQAPDYVVMMLTIMVPVALASIKIVIDKRRDKKALMQTMAALSGDITITTAPEKELDNDKAEKGKEKVEQKETVCNVSLSATGVALKIQEDEVNQEKKEKNVVEKDKDKDKDPKKIAEQMLMGGRRLNYLSVALSTLGFTINGAFVIGVPAEVYYNGATFSLIGFAWIIAIPLAAHFFVPLLHKLHLVTAYEVNYMMVHSGLYWFIRDNFYTLFHTPSLLIIAR